MVDFSLEIQKTETQRFSLFLISRKKSIQSTKGLIFNLFLEGGINFFFSKLLINFNIMKKVIRNQLKNQILFALK